MDWVPVAGIGTIHSWTTVRRAATRGFEAEVPYVVAIVELDDEPGVRFLGNLLISDSEFLEVGMSVEVEFTVRAGVSLPQWILRERDRPV